MLQPVLVIHGAGEPRLRHGKVYWEPLLSGDLGPSHDVQAPRMPQSDDPRYEAWAARIAELMVTVEPPILVGHSFGASTLLKFFAAPGPRPPFVGLFLVATPFWGPQFPEYALTPTELGRLRSVLPMTFYHSQDDPEVAFSHFERYQRELPRAVFRRVEGRGHEFDQSTFPELVADIRNLADQRLLTTPDDGGGEPI